MGYPRFGSLSFAILWVLRALFLFDFFDFKMVGPGGDSPPSSGFFEGVWSPEEGTSQGVEQRLPGALEIHSPGISGESLFRDLEQTRREPSAQAEAAPPAVPPVEPHIPVGQLKEELGAFLSSFGKKRKASSSFINRVADELGVERASPQKLGAIREVIHDLSQRRGESGLNSGQNAAARLTLLIEGWDKAHNP